MENVTRERTRGIDQSIAASGRHRTFWGRRPRGLAAGPRGIGSLLRVKVVLLVLLAILCAGGLWWLLAGSPSDGGRTGGPDPAAVEDPALLYLTRGTEVVTLWVKTPDGQVPAGAELGLR